MAYDIYSQTPVYDGEGVRPQSDVEIEIELRNAARNGDLVVSKRNPLTGGVEISAGGEPLELGSGVSYGTAAPNDADGKPDGAIYVRYAE